MVAQQSQLTREKRLTRRTAATWRELSAAAYTHRNRQGEDELWFWAIPVARDGAAL